MSEQETTIESAVPFAVSTTNYKTHAEVWDFIKPLRDRGIAPNEILDKLNELGWRTSTGCRFHGSTLSLIALKYGGEAYRVRRMVKSLSKIEAKTQTAPAPVLKPETAKALRTNSEVQFEQIARIAKSNLDKETKRNLILAGLSQL